MKSKSLAILGITAVISFVLSLIFSGNIILPQFFSVGNFKIHYYGIILAIAVGSAYYLLQKRAISYGVSKEEAENISLLLLVSGFIGARLYHVISSWDFYLYNLPAIFQVWNGGLSIFGAILGGLIGLVIFRRWFTKLNFLPMLDWLAPSVVLGQVIGRFGNLFNYEAYGLPTNLPWKMFVPEQFRIGEFRLESFFHPLFVYESLACLLILLILLKWVDITKVLDIKEKPGQVFSIWLMLYGLVRLGTETLRVDSPFLGDIKQNFLVALIAIAISLFFLIRSIIDEPNQT